MESITSRFIDDFQKIKSQGFVEGHRSHSTNIGKTLEDLLGIEENNSQDVDYKGVIEVKSQRVLSESWITLFTKCPTSPPRANTYLRDQFGYPDEKHPSVKVLYTSVFYGKDNSLKNSFSFSINEDENNLFLLIKAKKSDEIVSKDVFWSFDELKAKVEQKCSLIAFISAETKKVNGKEMFHFTKCKLLSGFSFSKFLEAVRNQDIMFDIRIGAYKTPDSKNYGKTHDHGSGFRIHKRSLENYFTVDDI